MKIIMKILGIESKEQAQVIVDEMTDAFCDIPECVDLASTCVIEEDGDVVDEHGLVMQRIAYKAGYYQAECELPDHSDIHKAAVEALAAHDAKMMAGITAERDAALARINSLRDAWLVRDLTPEDFNVPTQVEGVA